MSWRAIQAYLPAAVQRLSGPRLTRGAKIYCKRNSVMEQDDAPNPDTTAYKIGETLSEITSKFRYGYSCETLTF